MRGTGADHARPGHLVVRQASLLRRDVEGRTVDLPSSMAFVASATSPATCDLAGNTRDQYKRQGEQHDHGRNHEHNEQQEHCILEELQHLVQRRWCSRRSRGDSDQAKGPVRAHNRHPGRCGANVSAYWRAARRIRNLRAEGERNCGRIELHAASVPPRAR